MQDGAIFWSRLHVIYLIYGNYKIITDTLQVIFCKRNVNTHEKTETQKIIDCVSYMYFRDR